MEVSVTLDDQVAFDYERAYERYSPDVFRFLLAWTNEWSSAEDLTHEAYLRLWKHRTLIDWNRPILPWLLTTARRLANSRFRALRRRLAPWRSEESSDEAVRVRWMDLRAALVMLSPLERVALTMTAVEGWSSEQVAETLNTSAGAVRAAVSRARRKLEVLDAWLPRPRNHR